jgi:hypothetical protein
VRPQPSVRSSVLTVPAAAKLEVRLAEKLSTKKNKAGDTFRATLNQRLEVGGIVVAAKAEVEGRITDLQRSGRVKGLGELHLVLTRLRISEGPWVAISTESFVQTAESTAGSDAKKAGVAAGIGATIGAIAGGGKGAAIGAGTGAAAAGGVLLATRGKPAELAVEAVITFQLADAVTVKSL